MLQQSFVEQAVVPGSGLSLTHFPPHPNTCTLAIFQEIIVEKDERMVEVSMSHIGNYLSYNLSICSMVYLYGRGIPGIAITGLYLISSFYSQGANGEDAQLGDGNCVRGQNSMELVTISAMVLSFMTALSWSKAKLLKLYSVQIFSSLDHLNR